MKKRMKINFFAGIALVILAMIVSCEKDKEEIPPVDKTPVLNENFGFTVDKNIVKFTTTLTSLAWVTSGGTDYNFQDQKVDVVFADAGTYKFTCSVSDAGEILTSDTFDVVIAEGDTTIYDTEYWRNLTGGYNKSKSWVLDVEAKLFPGPISFLDKSYDFVSGTYTANEWMWDAPISWTFSDDPAGTIMEVPGTEGYGYMSFDLIAGKNFSAEKTKEDPESGTFTLDWETRSLTITDASILRSFRPFAEIQDDPNCTGDACATHIENGIDGISDWSNYKIYHLTDSVLRLAVYRDQDILGEEELWVIYNFIEKDLYDEIELPEEFTYTEPINTDFTSDDLVGTWKYAEIPQGWVAWNAVGNKGTNIPAFQFQKWDTRQDVIDELTSWGAPDVEATLTANDDNTYIFNADGSCTLNGLNDTINTTFTVSSGVITFADAIDGAFSLVWNDLTGTEIKAFEFEFYGDNKDAYTPLGIWLGQKNGDKNEYKAVQLIKQ